MSTSPGHAIRRYLAYLEDPSSAVDQDAIDEADKAFANATDPLDKLHAAAARERAREADVAGLERDFVANAKAYADGEHIPAAAFSAMGVPDEVLARAGFAVAPARGRRPSTDVGSRSAAGGRAPQVSAATLKAAAAEMSGPFTLAQLADRAGGGSPATVRKAVEELIAEGKAVSLGSDPDHTGPGRAPIRYEAR